MTTTLKLDFDQVVWEARPELSREVYERLDFLATLLEFEFHWRWMPSTNAGFHVEIIVFNFKYSPVVVVALQAILGSDWKRETYNLMRALVVDQAPDFWHQRWNVLYSTKLEGGGSVLNPDDYGSGKPTIKASDFPNHTLIPFTISDVDQTEVDKDGEARPKLILTFAEKPDHRYWPNVTSIRNLCAKLGTDETKWINKVIPLVKVKTNNPQTGKTVDALWVADPDAPEWETVNKRGGGGRGPEKKGRK
jgi:hypothetical protein